MRHYDMVISDIDGCITSENPEAMDLPRLEWIAEYNRLAATRLDRPQLTLCSGRPQPFTECLSRALNNLALPCVAENGVWLYDPRTNAYLIDLAITDDDLRAVADAETWFRREWGKHGLSIQPGKTASISLYCRTHERVNEYKPIIAKECRENGWPFRISASWFYINIDLLHVSKATGIQRLRELVDIDVSRIAGIGDTPGDLAIADQVAYFACPANADEAIHSRAHYISPHAETEGVIDILERLIVV